MIIKKEDRLAVNSSNKVLILHGWGGSDYPHWQAWIASELIKKNHTVSFPTLPEKDFPDLQSWLKFLNDEIKHFQPDIIICHSLANILWLHYTKKYKVNKIKKLMMVAPVRINCNIPELSTFFPYPLDCDLKADEAIMVGSTNDQYLSNEEVIQLASKLNIGLKILENAGHINSDSGYGELECALRWIEQ